MARLLLLLPMLVFLSACFVDSRNYRDLYESCETTTDCVGSADACFTVDWETGRGGMCSAYCEVHEDCPGFSSCWELVGDPDMQRVCYQRCDDDLDCGLSFTCVDAVMGTSAVDAICLPR